jgi:hypothetical protein
MTYRRPEEITHKGVRLSDALKAHQLWLDSDPNGERLDWRGASLNRAFLEGASLVGASLNGASLAGASLNRAFLECASLNGASLNGASLAGASLGGASLDGAWLEGTIGNMREVKTAQFDTWAVTWTTAPDGTVTLQIGCQKHPLDLWIKSDPRWIAALGWRATEWWAQYCDPVLALVQASPAKPWGEPQ